MFSNPSAIGVYFRSCHPTADASAVRQSGFCHTRSNAKFFKRCQRDPVAYTGIINRTRIAIARANPRTDNSGWWWQQQHRYAYNDPDKLFIRSSSSPSAESTSLSMHLPAYSSAYECDWW